MYFITVDTHSLGDPKMLSIILYKYEAGLEKWEAP